MTLSGRALWFIETRLAGDLSLETIADALGVSRFHLSRAFAAGVGLPLNHYIRARRLSEAAKVLAAGAPEIVQVALDAGYGSHEAFTRAFRAQFGLTPEGYRAQHPDIPLQEPLRMNLTAPIPLDPPRFVDHPELRIFGMGEECKAVGAASIPALWGRFGPYIGAVEGQIGHDTYGVIMNYDDGGGYRYIAGVEVRAFPKEPLPKDLADWDRVTIPARTYAVFRHRSHISEIAATFRAIWDQGMPGGYQAVDAASFEKYGPEFDARTGLGGCEIWIPVKQLGGAAKARLIRAMLFVVDLAKMEAFYAQALGLEPIQVTRLDNYIEFASGFALHAIPAEIAQGIQIAAPPEARQRNPLRLTFAVSNLAGTRNRLLAAGAQEIQRPWGDIHWVDPEGNVFALTEAP